MPRLTALLVLLLALGPAVAVAQPSYRVEIDAPEALAEPLRKGLGLVRWQDDPYMTAALLRRLAADAQQDARDVAAAHGYFSPQVRVSVQDQAKPWLVRLAIEPGPRTEVTEVDIRLTGPAASDPRAEEILARVRESWLLENGRPFLQEDWEESKRRARAELSRWRYAAARIVESTARIEPQARAARLSVVLDSGPPFRFGGIEVSGLRRYPAELVTSMSPVQAGDVYDRDLIDVYMRRLTETGYFASTQASIDDRPENAPSATLNVSVIEAPSNRLETGVSYNTDVGPRLQLRYAEQDLRESAWRLRGELALDAKIQEAELDLDSPPRSGGRWNNYFGRLRRTDIQNEVSRSMALGFAHNFGTDIAPSAGIASWHLEDRRVADARTEHRYAVYLGMRQVFRRTDEIVAPRSGYFGELQLGAGLPGLSTQAFVRLTGIGNYLLPLGRNGDLLLRAEAGVVRADERSGIPSEFLFRTGGDRTVRGYEFESIGVSEAGAIVGGRRLFLASIEYTHWITDNWGAAVFVDAGDAWDDGESFDAVVGHGIGARLRTPIGPARADIAYGRATGEYRLHLSIGYTF